jgi:mono/diheme cytochrome c family protein
MKRAIFPTISVLIAMLCAISAVAQEKKPSAERGQQTFMRVGCYQCHGTDGLGNGVAPALTPNTLPPIAIASFIRYSAGRMPVYPQEVLSDEEIADIVAYLQAVPPPSSADSIDLLKALKRAN